MNKKVNIAIDAMGGENSPTKVIEGINISLKSNKENFFFLYGQKDLLIKEINKNKLVKSHPEIIDTNDKGITVNLHEKINGFIKKSNLSKNKNEQKIERFAKGEKIDSKIISYDEQLRKINLSIKDKETDEEQKALSEYGSSDSGASLGDILGEALNKKKSV